MRLHSITVLGFIAGASLALAPQGGPYSVLRKVKVGGAGGFDYVYADTANRRLYIPRAGQGARVSIFNLDTFDSVGTLPNTSARGAVVDPRSNHGFASSKPVAMWDAKTLQLIKTIDVQGSPDGIMFDAFNGRVWVLSHSQPNATVIDAAQGTVIGTIDLGGAPEQAVSDGKGHVYVDIEDQENVAVVDAKTLAVTAHYSVAGKGGTCAGLAMDVKNRILFAACRNPANFVVLGADDGHIITTLPIGMGTDGATFNPATMEAFSSNGGGDGSLTIVKENSPTSFAVEQTLTTTRGAKTLTFDAKTGHTILIAQEYSPAPPAPAAGTGGAGAAAGGATAPGRGRAGGTPIPDSFTIWVVGKP